MRTHTPGPWVVGQIDPPKSDWDQGGVRIDAPGFEQLCYVWNETHRFGMDGKADPSKPFGSGNAEADGRLIAASPSMLALLQEADRLYSTYALTATGGLEVGAWINNVRAAIAAATGDK